MKKIDFSEFEVPGPRSKFKEGDTVVVYIPDRGQSYSADDYFRVYHPKYAMPYIGQMGTVRSVKRNQYGAKYAIKFDDGATIPIDTGFLLGPFISTDAAKKYLGKNGNVQPDVRDLKGYVNKRVQSNDELENAIKQTMCNDEVGFKWLEEPAIIKYKTFHLYVLAAKPNNTEIKTDAYTADLNFANESWDNARITKENSYPDLKNCFLILKSINPLTNELYKTSSIISYQRSTTPSSYFVQAPKPAQRNLISKSTFQNGKIVNPNDLFLFSVLPLTSTKRLNQYVKYFNKFETGFANGLDFFMAANNLSESQTRTDVDGIQFDEEMLGPDMNIIRKYDVNGSCTIVLKAPSHKIEFLPKSANNWLTIQTHYSVPITNLEGLDSCNLSKVTKVIFECPVQSLEHFPRSLNRPKVDVHFLNSLDNLRGIPSKFRANIEINQLRSFDGAKECDASGLVRINQAPTNLTGFFKSVSKLDSNIPEQDLERHRNYQEINKRLPELDGLF